MVQLAGSGELYAGLPGGLQRLLAASPLTEKKLLELSVAWTGLFGAQAQLANQLRVFVITWDPLEWLATRPDWMATVNIDHHGSELVVYIPVWSLVEAAHRPHRSVSAVLAAMAGAAVATAAGAEGAAAESAMASSSPAGAGRASDAGAALGTPTIDLVSAGWEDIGLGAITDIAQHAFGPVDLDRSPVTLAPVPQRLAACPACAGRRFGFPADLANAQARMCPAHDTQAAAVIRTRLARANASNPDGWSAIIDASSRLGRPHLPNGLAAKLAEARNGLYVVPEPAELARRAGLVVQAAGWFPGRATDFAIALGEEPDLAGSLPDWLVNLVLDLGHAGLGAEAAAVGEALAAVEPGLRSVLDGDVAVALAQAGLAEQALTKIADNLARWPGDFWVRVHAGDALLVLGDREQAAAHFRAAVDLAEETGDVPARSEAVERLRRLERLDRRDRRGSKPAPGRRPTTHPTGKAGRTRSRRKRGR